MLLVDFSDPQTNANPFPLFAQLRRLDPVHWSQPMKSWIVTRYADVKRITLDNSDLSADRLRPFFEAAPDQRRGYVGLMTYLGHWMVFRDPPDHTRLRRLFNKAFTPRSVEALKPNIAEIVDLLLTGLEAKARHDGHADWIADFAYPLPATVIMDLLGVPRTDLDRVKIWSDEIALFIGSARVSGDKYRRAEEGAVAMAGYFRTIVDQRTIDPQDDIISRLVAAHDEDEALTKDEIIATCILLLFAGHETTTNLLGNGLLHTLNFPDQWNRLKSEPSIVESAVEEWLRFDGPSGALARVAVEDVEIGGRLLKKGDRVYAFSNSANRDETQFDDPDALDLGRSPNPHLTFGHGIHFCLGAPLARMEAQIAAAMLIERFPNLNILPGFAAEWQDSLILRGIKSMPVSLS